MPTYYPQRLMDAAEKRDFMSGLEPFMLDLQKNVQAGISNLGSIVTGLQGEFTQGVESARQNLLPQPAPMPAPSPMPALGMGQDLSDRSTPGYLSSAVPEPTPTPAPVMASAGPMPAPALPPTQAAPAPAGPDVSSAFALPSWQDLTGFAPSAQQPAAQAAAPAQQPSPFTLPSFEQLTGLPERVVAAAAPVAAAVASGASGAASALTGPGAAVSGPSDVNAYLTYAAQKAGIDPAQVLAVMGKEGPTGWGSVGTFDTGTSFGPLQLHYAGGSNPKAGMGDRFTAATGIDLRKDSSLAAHQAAVDFAMGELAKRGDWSEWYGADNAFPAAAGGKGRFTPVARVHPVQPPTTQPAAAAPPPSAAQAAGAGLDVGGITQAYKGVPYTFGGPGGRGQGLGATTDCSGFVSAVWKEQYGLDLPAHTDAAYNALKGRGAPEVGQADARPGDVVFYMGAGTGGAITHHMGVYAGSGQVLDMSTSGGSGVKVRPVGHGGQFVILRDPRLNAEAPRTAQQPPPIVPTGVAERTGGQKVPQAQVDALSNRPTPGEPGGPALAPGPVWMPPPPAEAAPYQDTYDVDAVDVRGAAPPSPPVALHPRAATAFEQANGRPPTPAEAAELAALGFA